MDNTLHYYGDIVRKLFLGGAFGMLVTLPFVNALLPVPLFYSLLAIIILSLVAGFMRPGKVWTIVIDEIITIAAVLIFEYYAVDYYAIYSFGNWLFIMNQLLALDFLIALYFNTKTLRSMTA